jgi:hypothetical protein
LRTGKYSVNVILPGSSSLPVWCLYWNLTIKAQGENQQSEHLTILTMDRRGTHAAALSGD